MPEANRLDLGRRGQLATGHPPWQVLHTASNGWLIHELLWLELDSRPCSDHACVLDVRRSRLGVCWSS